MTGSPSVCLKAVRHRAVQPCSQSQLTGMYTALPVPQGNDTAAFKNLKTSAERGIDDRAVAVFTSRLKIYDGRQALFRNLDPAERGMHCSQLR